METIKELIVESAGKYGSKTALQMKVEGNWVRYSYREVLVNAVALGRILRQFGVGKGDRVAIFSENCPEWGIAYFSIINIGAIAVPIDCRLTKDIVLNISQFSGIKVIFSSPKLVEQMGLKDLSRELNSAVIVLDMLKIRENFDQIQITDFPLQSSQLSETEVKVSPSDLASIIFTSGTTGAPKGVMLSHYNFISNVLAVRQVLAIFPSDNLLSVLPLHHVFAFIADFLCPLSFGTTITSAESLQSHVLLETMKETKTTIMAGIPMLFEIFSDGIRDKFGEFPFPLRWLIELLKTINWHSRQIGINLGKIFFHQAHKAFGGNIRFFVSGGAKLNTKDAKFMKKLGFTILEGYGLTETSPVITFNALRENKIGSAGKPIPGVEVKINDPNEQGIGEIVTRGPNVMQGFYKNEAATKEVLKDGWFYTGDLGYLDKDNFLYITGRLKDVIITKSGKNVYPDEVEASYRKITGIKELCVFGYQNAEGDEEVFAAVIPDEQHFTGSDQETIRETIKRRLARRSLLLPSYKRIRDFIIWEGEFPKTSTRKIKKFEVKQKAKPIIDRMLPPPPVRKE